MEACQKPCTAATQTLLHPPPRSHTHLVDCGCVTKVWQWDGDDHTPQVIVHIALILNVDIAVLACTATTAAAGAATSGGVDAKAVAAAASKLTTWTFATAKLFPHQVHALTHVELCKDVGTTPGCMSGLYRHMPDRGPA